MPAPVLAEQNTTGIRCPSRIAASSGSCSASGSISPFSRYSAISFSSTSTTWSTSARCAASTEEKSDSPEGAKKQSETFEALPAGRLSGRHSLPKASWISPSSRSRLTPSASILLTMISRSTPRRSAHCRKRPVIISMPFCALMTIAAVSTAASAGSAWPRKSG